MLKYTLHEKVGTGGYADVYKAVDGVGIGYACKVLPKSKNKRVRVQKEVEVFKHLSKVSTRVPRFIEACEDEDAFYIIQEYCRGGSVKEYLSCKQDEYAENTVASIIRGVLRSLHKMHTCGVIHGDVKPANILLTDKSEDAEIRITDFGTSMWCDLDLVETPHLVGTPWFMAPESLGQKYCTRSDVWSVGVLTFQLLCGKLPYNDRNNPYEPTLPAVWHSILNDDVILKMKGRRWEAVSNLAKDFVRDVLQKEYVYRPTAEEALRHEWLTSTECADRFKGTPLYVNPFAYEDKARTF